MSRRRSSPCPNCGLSLDGQARYCPTCGEATGAVDAPPEAGPGAPANFAFSPDGRWLVFLDPFDTVELWPLGPPQPPLTITVPGLHDLTALSVALA